MSVVERCPLVVEIRLHTGFGESVVVTEIRELYNVYRSFIILRSKEGLTSFNKNNFVNFSGEKKKKSKSKLSRMCLFLEIR